jgi:hypothetical protein
VQIPDVDEVGEDGGELGALEERVRRVEGGDDAFEEVLGVWFSEIGYMQALQKTHTEWMRFKPATYERSVSKNSATILRRLSSLPSSIGRSFHWELRRALWGATAPAPLFLFTFFITSGIIGGASSGSDSNDCTLPTEWRWIRLGAVGIDIRRNAGR